MIEVRASGDWRVMKMQMGTPTAQQRWLARLELRSTISAADRDVISALSGDIEVYSKSTDIVKVRDRLTRCCLIVEGFAARYVQLGDGTRQLTAVYIPGDVADFNSLLLPVATAGLQAIGTTTVMFIDHAAIKAAADVSQSLRCALMRDHAVDQQIAGVWIASLGRKSATGRVARLLCEIACRHELAGWSRDSFAFPLTQTHLAEATGMTPVHANRVLRDIREAGVADLRNGRVVIFDWGRLTKIADFDQAVYAPIGQQSATDGRTNDRLIDETV